MTPFIWRNSQLQRDRFKVRAGEHELSLQRCCGSNPGTVIFILPGFAENSSIFWPENNQAGLAPFLASLGFDVFVADPRGKGGSWPRVSRHSEWGVHQLIAEDVPAYLSCIGDLRPGVAQVWLGEGMGSQLLICAYVRPQTLLAPVLGMIHFSAARRCELLNLRKALKYAFWQTAMILAGKFQGSVGGRSDQTESWRVFRDFSVWHQADKWKDPEDEFNYRVAARYYGLPPSLYINSSRSRLWGDINDTRLWLEELGEHDAQLISVGKKSGNLHNYSRRNLLLHEQAPDDHFLDLARWLDSKLSSDESE